MARMTGGQALVELLRQRGVDTIFALPGVQNDHLFTALYDARNSIRVIHPRHEQAAAYMAYGYAKASGRVGTYAVVPGPGVLNTTAALATAYAANAPVLCISGQIPLAMIGRGLGFLHEIPDQLGVLQRLTKWSARIEHPAAAPHLVDEAFRQMLSGRRRPVALEIPLDVLAQSAEVPMLAPTEPDPPPVADPAQVSKAAQLLRDAKRPLLIIGGGAHGASAEIIALAERLQAPIICSLGGKGAIDERHPLAINVATGHRFWAKADVVLAIGTRLQPQLVNWGLDDDLALIRIDIDPIEIGRVQRPRVSIVADAAEAVRAIDQSLGELSRPSPRTDEITKTRSEVDQVIAQLTPQREFVAAIRAAVPEDGIYVDELTQVSYVARLTYPAYRPRSFIDSGYQGTLGYGFPTALGAKVAEADRPVVSVSGDGGFMYNVQELATAVQQRIAVVAVVFVDNAFGNVKRMQREDYEGRVIASELHNPDFAAMARLFGAHGARATTPDQLSEEIRAAIKRPVPTVIEVPIGDTPSPWKLLYMGRARRR